MTRIQYSAIAGLALIVGFALFGAWLGTPAPIGESFGATIRAFASDDKTRLIIAAILIDVIMGIAAAIHIGIFDAQKVAKFHATNVLPYVLAYMLLWALQMFGLQAVLPDSLKDALASISFGTIVTTLTGSIINNIARLRAPIVATSDNNMFAPKPNDVQG